MVATDVESDPLTYTLSKKPRRGAVTLNASTGAFTYSPPTGFTGSESFTCKVVDGKSGSGSATITITVN